MKPRTQTTDKKQKPNFISGFKKAVGYKRARELWNDLKAVKK